MQNQIGNYSNKFSTSNTSKYQNNPTLLIEKYSQQHFNKGTYIFLPGEISQNLYLIIEGKVKLGIYLESGRSVTKSILGKGDIFGEDVLFGSSKYKYFANAWKPTTVCIIPIAEVKRTVNENNNLTFFLLEKLVKNYIKKKDK